MNASQNYYYGAFLINDRLKRDLWVCATYGDSLDYQGVTEDCYKRLNHHIFELEEMISMRENYENERLKSLVLDIDNPVKILETPGKYIQKFDPGYMIATSNSGRAHFYAPYKRIGNIEIDTYWFNLLVIWAVSILLYITLYYKLLQKLIYHIGNLRVQK